MNLVILDSGHAKSTPGKVAPDKSLYEWDFNNKMQYDLKKRLEEHNLKVCLINPNPGEVKDISLTNRANKSNNYYKSNGKPKTIMISLHANAFGEWTSARGIEVFHASNASQNSKNLAKYLCDQIYTDVKKIDSDFKNRGVKCEDFTVIYKTITPCALIEYAFYTNKEDLKILKNNRYELVEATVKAICKYFNITYKQPKSTNQNIKTGWVKDDKGWSYIKDGVWQYNWKKIDNKWYYLKGGYAVTGWNKIDNKWYYFDGSCAMVTGWLKDKDKWYYLKEDGSMAIGWLKVDNKWYYLRNNGSMVTGLLQLENKKYFLKDNGELVVDTKIEIDSNGEITVL